MAEIQERRRAQRVPIGGRLAGRARATQDVRLLDISTLGARIQHLNLLRPGSACALELPPVMGALFLSARVVRSTVVGTEKSPEGDRLLRYETGLAFIGVTIDQQASLADALEKLTPGREVWT
jgi:hypothetical protein